jgi:TRAP-type C4-dicarboxylate transport system permease small subunit
MHRFFLGLATGLAIVGGAVLAALVLMVVVSIIGREAGLGAITGDYELVEAGTAFAVFAFLPYAQITGGHAVVDVFTTWLPDRAGRILETVIALVFAAVLVLIAVQLFHGTMAKYNSGQTSFLLQFPLWWPYAASLAAAIAGAVVGVYVAGARIVEAATGRSLLPEPTGATD